MQFSFIKCHGSGNDFPLIDARGVALDRAQWAQVARALADRAGPVGGDGLLLLTQGDSAHPFGMAMYNSDGSEAETCLNGLRCVARAGFEALGIDEAAVRLKTSSAEVSRAEAIGGVAMIRETAGPATTDVIGWPLQGEGSAIIDRPIAALGSDRAFTAVAMPNPHLVSFVDRIDDAELRAIGQRCEAAPDWLPNRANVSFVEVRDGALYVRTFERGVGLTDSCGSAMAASGHAACLTGRLPFDREVTVLNRGGMVRALMHADAMVTLSGNATFEWRGAVDVDLTTGVAGELTIEARFDDEVDAWRDLVRKLG